MGNTSSVSHNVIFFEPPNPHPNERGPPKDDLQPQHLAQLPSLSRLTQDHRRDDMVFIHEFPNYPYRKLPSTTVLLGPIRSERSSFCLVEQRESESTADTLLSEYSAEPRVAADLGARALAEGSETHTGHELQAWKLSHDAIGRREIFHVIYELCHERRVKGQQVWQRGWKPHALFYFQGTFGDDTYAGVLSVLMSESQWHAHEVMKQDQGIKSKRPTISIAPGWATCPNKAALKTNLVSMQKQPEKLLAGSDDMRGDRELRSPRWIHIYEPAHLSQPLSTLLWDLESARALDAIKVEADAAILAKLEKWASLWPQCRAIGAGVAATVAEKMTRAMEDEFLDIFLRGKEKKG